MLRIPSGICIVQSEYYHASHSNRCESDVDADEDEDADADLDLIKWVWFRASSSGECPLKLFGQLG